MPGDGAPRHPERVASIPEKLNEDEAKGWTLKHLHALADQLGLHRLGHEGLAA